METLAQLQGLTVKPSHPAIHATSRRLRLVAEDKSQLDQMIQAEQARGWLLIYRSYSLDDGHGAMLLWNAMQAA